MAISFVNGFLCTCPCDVAKARKGEDPHPSTNAAKTDTRSRNGGVARADQPAVLLGGSLSARPAADRVQEPADTQATDASTSWSRKLIVDLLV